MLGLRRYEFCRYIYIYIYPYSQFAARGQLYGDQVHGHKFGPLKTHHLAWSSDHLGSDSP